ncbi:hypothetical protein D9615_003888 [Tricholomella constricta]|uniref:DH domain-containing protein n=1 Tax=Tricholomella constricta TaxID=117010 RepID=A0A8H5M509_9AGAR|nr:hypothetical protein D9615_003888 [Tricholomella constricta]
MKAFFHRLHLGGGPKDKDKDKDKDRDKDSPIQKEKFPPLRSWPPDEPQRATCKPLPEIVSTTNRPLPPIDEPTPSSTPTPPYPSPLIDPISSDLTARAASPRTDSDSTARSARKVPNGTLTANDVQKKVAFISPPPTPVNTDRTLPDAPAPTQPAASPPLKTTVSRFQATHGKEPRASLSTAASSSKADVATTANKTSVKATSTRASSPYLQKQAEAASAASLRSGTPYSQMSTNSGSRILAATSWSEVTEEDLVSNLGSRERTRQEVLFEIISSEERYVQELIKMKDTFIDPLLHPFSTSTVSASPLSSTPNFDYDYYRAESPLESGDHLPPIAARFMSPSPSGPPPSAGAASIRTKETPNIDGESLETDEDDTVDDHIGRGYSRRVASPMSKADHPRSPYRGSSTKTYGRTGVPVPFPTRSHMSLPPPPRNQMSASTHSLGRQSTAVDRDRERKHSQGDAPQKTGMLRKFKKSSTSPSAIFGNYLAPHQLPEDLRICLEVVDSGVLDGHKRLSEALKKRYDEQFPLVRSLADVFVSNSDIFHGYATYVLHLERALEQVDAALHNVSTKKPKKQDAGEWQKVCKLLQKLEENACDKGETGLAITLSKPFQRLLKYPLLFQNLLFHTDPSTFEYESTLQMVAEVETIVRSIEDEKIQKEERDKTRDVFARIEGLDKVKQLALPKPSRVLVEERQCTPGLNALNSSPKPSSPPPVVNSKGVRGKSSFKRLSDVLHSGNSGIGGKKDLWFVVFNDVVLQCQRTGTTSLPLVAATTSRTNSLPELQGKAKYATTGRRNVQTKPRNLYKFIKIETWAIGDVMQPREGVVSMEDVVRSRTLAQTQPRIVPLPADDEDGNDSDDSDKKSKMSFSYWGADKVTVQKPMIKGRVPMNSRRGGAAASYGRESSANAKFGTRLVSNDNSPNQRPSSRRTQAVTPTSRRAPPMDDSNYAKATVTRPAWGAGAGSPAPPPSKRSRNTSQTSASTRVAIPAKALGSPAPSEDSGVGLYRQMLAQDPSLNNT